MEVNKAMSLGINSVASCSALPEYELTENVTLVSNALTDRWLSFKADVNMAIDFTKFIFRNTRQERQLTFRYEKYPITTISTYRRITNYPDPGSKDSRPLSFDPLRANVVAHGTNFEAVLRAIINCNLQIVPVIKQFKLQGIQPSSGESAKEGSTALNCRYVSTVYLKNLASKFSYAIEYAHKAASEFRAQSDDFFNSMPVVIIGDGFKLSSGGSDIPNEMQAKRINIRILAFKNEKEKERAMAWLNRTYREMGIEEIKSLLFCTFKDLNECLRKNGNSWSDRDVPDIPSLIQKCSRLE